MPQHNPTRHWLLVVALPVVALVWLISSCATNRRREIKRGNVSVAYQEGGSVSIRSHNLLIDLSPQQALSVSLQVNGRELSLNRKAPETAAMPSDYVTIGGKDIQHFAIQYSRISMQNVGTRLGNCQRVEIPSRSAEGESPLAKVLHIDLCSDFPQTAVLTSTYENSGPGPLEIERVVQAAQTIDARGKDGRGLWTFQGASLDWGRDFIFALPTSFHSENPLGQMLPGAYGGGIPVNDFWSGPVGMAIGHLEPESVACSLPVESLPDQRLRISLETRPKKPLAPQESFTTPRSFITVHRGDFYEALAIYSALLRAQGLDFMKPSESLYQPVWWTYAFGHNFRPAEVYNSIPKFKELGIRWIIINNRWWDHYGDWMPRADKFRGEPGFRQMLARLHREGLKSLLWWLPYGVQMQEFPRSGLYTSPARRPKQSPEVERMISASADVALQHRDWLIEDPQGKLVPISRNLAALCPAYPPARDYMVQLARRMIRDWRADGFYMDVIYTVPACHNPAHHHSSPYDSVRELASLFQEFRKVVEQYAPEGMLMVCPCGTTLNHCLLPTLNEPVTADPVGAEQIRWRVKMYKALLGPRAAVFADRVESTQFEYRDGADFEAGKDFASCMGSGGILGTLLIWPKIDKLPGDLEFEGEMEGMKQLLLTPEKASLWKKWFDLYHQKMLSQGEFLNLYTLGFDEPEGYAIRKDSTLYYAFFAPAPRAWGLDKPPRLPKSQDNVWEGRLELRGLDPSKQYRVSDYENGKDLGVLSGSSPSLGARFSNHLLLEVTRNTDQVFSFRAVLGPEDQTGPELNWILSLNRWRPGASRGHWQPGSWYIAALGARIHFNQAVA